MKELRVTVRVDPDRAPAFFDLLANSPDVDAARVLDLATTPGGVTTLLLVVEGDPAAFAEGATGTPGVESVDLSETRGDRTAALVVMRPLETPVFAAIHRASTRAGVVVRTPVVYRDGEVHGRAVGDPDALQRAFDVGTEDLDVRVEEVGAVRLPGDPAATLSDRQREAVEAALELGYYDRPREATHEDVAAAIGCAPATASEHLQKAEATLVRSGMDALRRG